MFKPTFFRVATISAILSLTLFTANAQVYPIYELSQKPGFQSASATTFTWQGSELETYQSIIELPRYNRSGETAIGSIFTANQLQDLKELLDILPTSSKFRARDVGDAQGLEEGNGLLFGCDNNPRGLFGDLNVYNIGNTVFSGTPPIFFDVALFDCNNIKSPVITANVAGKIGFSTSAPEAKYHFKTADFLVGESTGMQFKVDNAANGMTLSDAGAVVFKVNKSGKVYAREFEVTLSAFPDYVFDKSYKLLSLEETEEYIQRHRHLPGMRSAEEYEAEGTVNVGDLQLKLVEKVEELTLHMISQQKQMLDQQKQMIAQQKEIEALKAELAKRK